MKMIRALLSIMILSILVGCEPSEIPLSNTIENETYTNIVSEERMLLVLAAPSIHNEYYSPAFEEIVEFHINYAKAIMEHDNVVVLVDEDTLPYYESLPSDILLTQNIEDIWMRDFSTANPLDPIQFTYTWASMTKEQSKYVQSSFERFADEHDIQRAHSPYLLDGGNIVDNYAGKVIVSTRFLEDNELSYDEGKHILKDLLGASEVALIEPDEEVLAHSDGMLMWIDEDTLLVNNYSDDTVYQEELISELEKSFPTSTIIEIPVAHVENPSGVWEGFSSACGVNVNAVLTHTTLYVPTFEMEHEQRVLDIIKQNTDKNIVTINAQGVCPMGGSARCLTWQVTGSNAEKLILAARKDR